MTSTLAMMMCIRNEESMLKEHLTYHRLLGVQHAYVFLNRCTDASAEIAALFPWVTVLDRPNDEKSTSSMEPYQNACAAEALSLARRDQFSWLLHVDVDEFAWGDSGETGNVIISGSLITMLDRVDPGCEMVVMPTWEVLPVRCQPGTPFWEQNFFQTSSAIVRDVLDPMTGEVRELNKWIGHNQGKSIVRTSAAVFPRNQHRWAGIDKELMTTTAGRHYHFVVTSAERWRTKYKKLSFEAAHWPNGAAVPFPKQAWKEASVTLSAEDAVVYYNRWVAVSPNQAEQYVSEGKAVRDRRVQEVLALAED